MSVFVQGVETDKNDCVGKLAARLLKLLLDRHLSW